MIEEPLLEIIQLSRSSGFALLVIGTWPQRDDEVAVEALTKRYEVPYVNVVRDILGGQPYPISHYERHFNRQAHALIAYKLADLVRELVAHRLAASP